VETLSLEIQDGVDDVLEHARPRHRALLRYVADQEDGEIVALCDLQQTRRAFAQL
jgi:hypothetical protein